MYNVSKSSNFIQLCTTMWAWCRKFDIFGSFGRRPAAVDAAKLPRTREGSDRKFYKITKCLNVYCKKLTLSRGGASLVHHLRTRKEKL